MPATTPTTTFYLDEDAKVWTEEQLKADHASLVANGDLFDEMADFDVYLEEASGRNGTLQWITDTEAQRITALFNS